MIGSDLDPKKTKLILDQLAYINTLYEYRTKLKPLVLPDGSSLLESQVSLNRSTQLDCWQVDFRERNPKSLFADWFSRIPKVCWYLIGALSCVLGGSKGHHGKYIFLGFIIRTRAPQWKGKEPKQTAPPKPPATAAPVGCYSLWPFLHWGPS